jgi:iron(III) transport system substrate-binding protein
MSRKKMLSWVIATIILVACLGKSVPAISDEKKVVVYSTHDEAMLELIADMFTKETGIKVDFINLKGALADRVRAEKNNPQADVMYGAPSSVYIELKQEKLFTNYLPQWADKLNPTFKDPDGFWFGTIQTPVVLFYNTEMLKSEDAPKDWEDLTAERFKNQLVFRNALSSSARATYCALLQQHEKQEKLDAGWAFLKDRKSVV